MIGWRVIPRIGFGKLTVSPHGVAIAIAYFIGAYLTSKRVRAKGMNEDHFWNAAGAGVVGAILGARVAYVAGHYSEFPNPIEWLQIYKGGISIIGGFLGGFLAAYIYLRLKRGSFFGYVDLGMAPLALAIAFGRLGDLAIGDHLGKQTSGWWGWRYAGGELISPPPCTYRTFDGCIHPGMVVHQTAAYDLVWSLVIFGILVWLGRKERRPGFFFFAWAALYAMGRVATDLARVDKHWFGLGLTGSQLTSLAVLFVCCYFLIRYKGAKPSAEDKESAPAQNPPPI